MTIQAHVISSLIFQIRITYIHFFIYHILSKPWPNRDRYLIGFRTKDEAVELTHHWGRMHVSLSQLINCCLWPPQITA